MGGRRRHFPVDSLYKLLKLGVLDHMIDYRGAVSLKNVSLINFKYELLVSHNYDLTMRLFREVYMFPFSGVRCVPDYLGVKQAPTCRVLVELPDTYRQLSLRELARPELVVRNKREVNAFVQRILHLEYSYTCDKCMVRNMVVHPFWYLGKCLCKICLKDEFVSNLYLEERYGMKLNRQVALLDKGVPEGKFSASIAGKVYFFAVERRELDRKMFSRRVEDLMYPLTRPSFFYSWSDLQKLVDFEEMKKRKDEREFETKRQKDAVKRLWTYMSCWRLRAMVLFNSSMVELNIAKFKKGSAFQMSKWYRAGVIARKFEEILVDCANTRIRYVRLMATSSPIAVLDKLDLINVQKMEKFKEDKFVWGW